MVVLILPHAGVQFRVGATRTREEQCKVLRYRLNVDGGFRDVDGEDAHHASAHDGQGVIAHIVEAITPCLLGTVYREVGNFRFAHIERNRRGDSIGAVHPVRNDDCFVLLRSIPCERAGNDRHMGLGVNHNH